MVHQDLPLKSHMESPLQIKELNARLRQMAEDKRAIQKDRDRLEQKLKSNVASVASEGSSQVGRLRIRKLFCPTHSGTCSCADARVQG
jgi:hypothetical protein